MNKKMKKVLLTALPTLSLATSFVCLTSCSSKDIFNGNEAFLIAEDGSQIWVKSLVDSNICPVKGKENMPITIDDKHQYERDEFNLQIVLNPKLEAIPNNFLFGCSKFNKGIRLDYLNIKSIGDCFLQACQTFNHKLELPPTLETIGDNFVNSCIDFNSEIIFPNNLKFIGKKFLSLCTNFDQPIVLPDGIEIIEEAFMQECESFQKGIHMPNNLKIIKDSFMYWSTKSFHIDNLLNCTQLEEIGSNFMDGCTGYNNPLNFSNTKLKSISNSFLYRCTSMKSPIFFGDLPSTIFKYEEKNLNFAMDTESLTTTNKIPISGTNMQEILNWEKEIPGVKTLYRNLVSYPGK